MSTESKSTSVNFGVIGLLGVAFVVLKLCKVINWSWWWVTLPFWGGIAIVLLGFLIAVIIGLIAYIKD